MVYINLNGSDCLKIDLKIKNNIINTKAKLSEVH